MTGLAQDTRVEAVDGPAPIRDLVGKGMPILTRLPSGARGFRILSKVTASPSPVPVICLELDNGRSVTLGGGVTVYKVGVEAGAAADLRSGDVLEPAWHYPKGYRLRAVSEDATHGAPDGAEPGIRVVSTESAGEDTVYTGRVNETGCLFLAAGILCRLG